MCHICSLPNLLGHRHALYQTKCHPTSYLPTYLQAKAASRIYPTLAIHSSGCRVAARPFNAPNKVGHPQFAESSDQLVHCLGTCSGTPFSCSSLLRNWLRAPLIAEISRRTSRQLWQEFPNSLLILLVVWILPSRYELREPSRRLK